MRDMTLARSLSVEYPDLHVDLGPAGNARLTPTKPHPPMAVPTIFETCRPRDDVLAGVADGDVASIFRLDTSYGGGKTHGLIALAHAARGLDGVENPGEFVEPSVLPEDAVRVAAFDGENADPANGRDMGEGLLAYAPWGELAYALGGHAGCERVRESDRRRMAAGADEAGLTTDEDGPKMLVERLSPFVSGSTEVSVPGTEEG